MDVKGFYDEVRAERDKAGQLKQQAISQVYREFRECVRDAFAQPEVQELVRARADISAVSFDSNPDRADHALERQVAEPLKQFGSWQVQKMVPQNCLAQVRQSLARLGEPVGSTSPHETRLTEIARQELSPFGVFVWFYESHITMSVRW